MVGILGLLLFVPSFVFILILFGRGFLRPDFTERLEIWHEASPIS